MHANYRITQHLFWNVAWKHRVFSGGRPSVREERLSLVRKVKPTPCLTNRRLTNRTSLLALVGDTGGTGAVQMKPADGTSLVRHQERLRRGTQGPLKVDVSECIDSWRQQCLGCVYLAAGARHAYHIPATFASDSLPQNWVCTAI